MMRILLLCLLFVAIHSQTWSEPIALLKSNDNVYVYVWHRNHTRENHLLLVDGHSTKITISYFLPGVIENPIEIDSYEKGHTYAGAYITGTPDAKRIMAIYCLFDKFARKYRIYVKESTDSGYSWGRRMEVGPNDKVSRKRPSGFYTEKTGRAWLFYERENGTDSDRIYAVTKTSEQFGFTAEIKVDDFAKLLTNVDPVGYDNKILLAYRKVSGEDEAATHITNSINGGLRWDTHEVTRDKTDLNTSFYSDLKDAREPFLATVYADESKSENKTIKFSLDLGKTWISRETLLPSDIIASSLTICKNHEGEKVIGVYSRNEVRVGMFHMYNVDPWVKINGVTPPVIGGDTNLVAVKVTCGKIGSKPAFFAYTITLTNDDEHILSMTSAIIE